MPDNPIPAITKAAIARKSESLRGEGRAPGDKSISHRSVIFGALASGTTTVSGLLEGADIMSTASAMQALGAKVTKDGGVWHIQGCGEAGLKAPSGVIDCGNAGTGVRLIMGAAAGYAIDVTYTGDASLRSRPMGRITKPLALMGIQSEAQDGGRLPVTIHGGQPQPVDYLSSQASAQVKSAVLLAGTLKRSVRISLIRYSTVSVSNLFQTATRPSAFSGRLFDTVTGIFFRCCHCPVPLTAKFRASPNRSAEVTRR